CAREGGIYDGYYPYFDYW
nr:immunoglobulin heavy chain junction region [Mus musculus]